MLALTRAFIAAAALFYSSGLVVSWLISRTGRNLIAVRIFTVRVGRNSGLADFPLA